MSTTTPSAPRPALTPRASARAASPVAATLAAAASWPGPAPRGCENPSQVEHPGRAFGDQAGALDVAAHRAKVAMAGVAHDVLVADTLGIGFGDEADAQRVGAHPVEALERQPGHGDAVRQDSPNGVGVQRLRADAVAGADAAEQRPGLLPRDRLSVVDGAHQACLDVPAARQADLSPLPRRIGLAARDPQRNPPATIATSSTRNATNFGAAQRAGETDQQQRAVGLAAGGAIAGGDQLAQHRERQGCRFLHRAPVCAQQSLLRLPDVAVRRVSRTGR